MKFVQQLRSAADLPDEPTPGQPLIEISGESRVLIEQHGGVVGYTREVICVRVKYGKILVCGQDLTLNRMSKEQLIICGRIECVRLERGVG